MTGRVLPFESSSHAAVDALLPFYVNATLEGEELALVEQHVRGCDKCQREVENLRAIFDACAALALPPVARRGEPAPLREVAGRAPQRGLGARIRNGLQTTQPFTRWLLAAQLAAIVVLGTLLAADPRDAASYRTLGNANPSAQSPEAVAVIFDPAATESEMRRIVLRVGARIVDGPTTTDAFVLEVPAGRMEQTLQALRTEHAVRLAERLGPRTGH